MTIVREHEVAVAEAAALSRTSLTRSLGASAELGVFSLREPACVLGAFQRACELDASALEGRPVFRRASGGPATIASDGVVWVQLALSRPDALVACEPAQIVNRHVRPLLRALTKLGALSQFFGREWVSSRHRPTAFVGFAHDTQTRRSLFEAFVPVRRSCWLGPRASFDGKEPWTLEEVVGKSMQNADVCAAIVAAYRDAYDPAASEVRAEDVPRALVISPEIPVDPPWQARADEAIGPIFAGRDAEGRMRLGGEFMIACNVHASFEHALNASGKTPSQEALDALVDEHFAPPEAALFGVRDLVSIRTAVTTAFDALAKG